MFKASFILVSVFLAVVVLTNCDNKTLDGDGLKGEWVATGNDTIYIMDDSNFYHSSESMRYDHYDYSVSGDSILIGYSGKMMILVVATKHYFKLKGDDLIIDFSNRQCFGFPKERIEYKRVQKIVIE